MSGGNLRTSLKSIEFSDGGFHFKLDIDRGPNQLTSYTAGGEKDTYMLGSVPEV